MKVARTRSLVLLVVAVGVLGLTGCQTKAGAAAVVGDTRISERDVADYLVRDGTDLARARGFVLTFLVKGQLYAKFLSAHGGVPSEAELRKLHDSAIAGVLSQSLGAGDAADAQIDRVLGLTGVRTAMRLVVVRSAELETAAFLRVGKSSGEFFPVIAAAGIRVSISPRYGSWNAVQQEVGTATRPGFLAPLPSVSASPAG